MINDLTNDPRTGLAIFILSTPVSLVSYFLSGETVFIEVCLIIVITCASLSFLPFLHFVPYERKEEQPPINSGDNENWLDEIREVKVNYEITPPTHHIYAQQLAFDPCP